MMAGQIRKGMYMVIKGRPCEVTDISTSKTGKHGHAKCLIKATDIFTGKQLEVMVPASHNAEVPFVERREYQVLGIDEDEREVHGLTDVGGTTTIKVRCAFPTHEHCSYITFTPVRASRSCHPFRWSARGAVR